MDNTLNTEDNISNIFPEGFNTNDKVVLARVFMDKAETQFAASLLRVKKIPHFIADSNATLFTENVLGGERLFVREEDLEIVAETLGEIKKNQYDGEEDWYKEVRTKQGYKPYQLITYSILVGISIIALGGFIYYLYL